MSTRKKQYNTTQINSKRAMSIVKIPLNIFMSNKSLCRILFTAQIPQNLSIFLLSKISFTIFAWVSVTMMMMVWRNEILLVKYRVCVYFRILVRMWVGFKKTHSKQIAYYGLTRCEVAAGVGQWFSIIENCVRLNLIASARHKITHLILQFTVALNGYRTVCCEPIG